MNTDAAKYPNTADRAFKHISKYTTRNINRLNRVKGLALNR